VLVPALAACASGGSGDGSAGTGAGLREQAAPVWREAAQCIRDHGYPDFPDPVVADDGTVQLSDEVDRTLNAQHQDAVTACEPILGRLPAAVLERARGGDGGGPSPELIEERKRFARCMREHGERDWPDPDADGGFTLPTTPGFGKGPDSSAALTECRKLLRDPNGDLGVH
jgi:hypothetical protein